jgi:MoaA/NifB/PqqE/SkfB family radical SAM enzyme
MHTALRHARALLVKTRPVHLTFFATRRCNARCGFCFYEAAREAEGGAPELSAAEVRRVAGSMGPLLWVLFSGGEPFLREDLVELSGIFHDANEPTFLTYPTNGLLPEVVAETVEGVLRRCAGSVVVVKLSLDGVGERHDALRGVPGAFAKVMATCERLAALAARHPRLEVGVNTLYCSHNEGEMDDILELVHGLEGVTSHTLTLIRGGARDASFREVDLERYRDASRRLAERWSSPRGRFPRFAGARLKAAQDVLQRGLVHRTMSRRRRETPCYAGRLNLVLTERGELHPCEGRWDLSFGNVRDAGYDVAAMLRSAAAREVRREVAGEGCFCSNECNTMTNILFNPARHPGLIREWARLRLGWAAGTGAGAGRVEPSMT